ncbi:MAG TPA: alpha/beta fold hydrolase [Pirellulales bacterium]|jgi:hypothetical protein|nr:alpha/beta fold hydrolase [Pirellulales bacterium]
MTILFLHGWQSVPGGAKPTYLKNHGHQVINPKLSDEDFSEAVRIAQAAFDKYGPQVVVGSSRGGAVAMNLNSGEAKLVLLCPAWRKFGTAETAKPGTVILHSRADDVVPFADSEELVRNSGLAASALIEVGNDHRLADPEPLETMLRECGGAPTTLNPGDVVMPDQSANYRQIALVAGYHPCSFPPPTAYDAGLKQRFAVVLSSYRPDKEDMFFDAELFVLIADALLQAIPHDSLDIEFGVGAPHLKSLTELTELYASQNEIDHEPPNSMKAFFGDRLVAVEETEPWAAVGGPAPYHDSFTMSFYTAEERTAEFRRICEAVACQSGVTVTAFHEAERNKEPFVPWWRQPLRWLGAKPW